MSMATAIGATTRQPAQATAPLVTSICACGQDLDVYRSKHCPRCGVTLRHLLAPAA